MNIFLIPFPLVFGVAIVLTLVMPLFFSGISFFFFAPVLVISYYQKRIVNALWIALASGLILDLASAHSRLGIHALNFCITTIILYGQKRHFFADNPTTLPIMTFLFSIISSIVALILFSVFLEGIPISFPMLLTDFIVLPLLDAAWAFILFVLPQWIFKKTRRI